MALEQLAAHYTKKSRESQDAFRNATVWVLQKRVSISLEMTASHFITLSTTSHKSFCCLAGWTFLEQSTFASIYVGRLVAPEFRLPFPIPITRFCPTVTMPPTHRWQIPKPPACRLSYRHSDGSYRASINFPEILYWHPWNWRRAYLFVIYVLDAFTLTCRNLEEAHIKERLKRLWMNPAVLRYVLCGCWKVARTHRHLRAVYAFLPAVQKCLHKKCCVRWIKFSRTWCSNSPTRINKPAWMTWKVAKAMKRLLTSWT